MKYKFLEMTAHFFNEAKIHYEKTIVSHQINNFMGALSKANNDNQITDIKDKYDTWSKRITDDLRAHETISIFLDRFEQILEFAYAIATTPDKVIPLYENQLKFNQRDGYILNFHLGCLQIFSYLDKNQPDLLVEAQKNFNVAQTYEWHDKEDLNFWQALAFYLKKDSSGCDYFLNKFFHESKNVSEFLLEDNYIPWLKNKIPFDFMSYAKKNYNEYLTTHCAKKHL